MWHKNNILKGSLRIFVPLILGGVILWWMYRGFDRTALWQALSEGMDWKWMWLSMPFGVLAQWLRALRWKQSLQPLGYQVRLGTCVHAIFLSYASSLVVPRIGEVLRCGILKRYDGTPFSAALGTVVTERIVDSIVMLMFSALTVLMQVKLFGVFFTHTGMSFSALAGRFTATGYWVTAACLLVLLLFALFMCKRLSLLSRTKGLLQNVVDGLTSLRQVRRKWLYVAYSIGLWLAYFLHFYLTFFCFNYTRGLGVAAAMAAFVVGSFAVLVPTPNGAGPWHFAVKTVLILFGVAAQNGVIFVLIVHTLQTLLVVLLGLISIVGLAFMHRVKVPLNER